MTKHTKEALEELARGIEGLLHCLSAEQELRIDYDKTVLMKAAEELKAALLSEPTKD